MPVRAEVQRRAEYLGRAMKEGLTPLWAFIGVAITLIGGSVTLAAIWGVRHLIWVPIIVLLVLLAVLAEGSYRMARNRETEHRKRLAELEGERDAKATELEDARAELEDARRVAIAAPAKPGSLPFDLCYYTRPCTEYGGWVTSHYIAIKHPPGQPERRVYVIQDDMKPEPRFRSPQGPGRPGFPYFVPPAGGGDGGAGVLIRPGQEESWFLGYTGTGGIPDNVQMSVFEFNVTNHAKLYWQLYPDESWRFFYHVKCDGVESEMPFSIVVDSLDGKTIRVRQQG
jgi:hypothetical protein